jgi:hypothetical protein
MPLAPTGVAFPEVRSHMFWAVLSAVFCLPTGVIALLYAAAVQGHLNNNDANAAQRASRRALAWVIAGPAFVGAIVIVGAVVEALALALP